jgi:hypothetical protein
VREALLAYEQQLREAARTEYHQALLRYSVLAPWVKQGAKPPTPPPILEG